MIGLDAGGQLWIAVAGAKRTFATHKKTSCTLAWATLGLALPVTLAIDTALAPIELVVAVVVLERLR